MADTILTAENFLAADKIFTTDTKSVEITWLLLQAPTIPQFLPSIESGEELSSWAKLPREGAGVAGRWAGEAGWEEDYSAGAGGGVAATAACSTTLRLKSVGLPLHEAVYLYACVCKRKVCNYLACPIHCVQIHYYAQQGRRPCLQNCTSIPSTSTHSRHMNPLIA